MKTLHLLSFLMLNFFLSGIVLAQVAMTHTNIKPAKPLSSVEKKAELPKIIYENETVYVNDENKIYVNKNLPIYLKFSTTPDGKTYDLKSLKHPEDAEPFYLDTEGPNYIRTKWAVNAETREYVYPLREVEMELYADSKAPIVRPEFSATNAFNNEGTTYYGRDLAISLKEWDEQAGVRGSFWSLNNDAWASGKADFADRKAGRYSYTFYSVDNVNNYSDPQTFDFAFDNEVPSTSLLKTDEGTYVFGPKTPLQFQIDEKYSGVNATYFRIASLDFMKSKEGQLLPVDLEDGEYKIDFYSVDNVNNGEESQSMEIYLDKIAPETSLDATSSFMAGSMLYVSALSKISLSAVDNKAGVREIKFSTRGFQNEIYSNPIILEAFHGQGHLPCILSPR